MELEDIRIGMPVRVSPDDPDNLLVLGSNWVGLEGIVVDVRVLVTFRVTKWSSDRARAVCTDGLARFYPENLERFELSEVESLFS